MTKWDDEDLAKWLEAEAAGAAEDADRLFAALASTHLQRCEAPSGFAGRVLAALPTPSADRSRAIFDLAASWWVRLTAVTAVVLLGLGLALVSPRHVLAFSTEAALATARFLHDGTASVGAAFGIWKASLDLFTVLGQASALVFTTGLMPALIVANLAIAAVAFLGLKRLLALQEECF